MKKEIEQKQSKGEMIDEYAYNIAIGCNKIILIILFICI